MKKRIVKICSLYLLIFTLVCFFSADIAVAKVTPQPNTDSIFTNATLVYKSKEYTANSEEMKENPLLPASLLGNDWPVAWADIAPYITAVHRAQGFIDILLTVDMTPRVTGLTPTVAIYADSDNRADNDFMASCDGALYDMIDTDCKGQWETFMLNQNVNMENDNYVTLRFAVPQEVTNYYKLFLGQRNIRPYKLYSTTSTAGSYSDFYQVKLYTPALTAGPYACPDVKVPKRFKSEYDPNRRVFPIPSMSRTVVEDMPVTFDGSKSLDTSGATITKYEWDFDSDGIYDAEGVSPTHIYTIPGTYTVTLRITNSDNLKSASNGSVRSAFSSAPLPLVINVVAASPENKLYQNGPNPLIPSKNALKTIINYDLKESVSVSLKVYTVSGELIKTLVDEPKPAGTWSTEWDGTNESGEKVA
ncbi:MAG: PKD domain-containing protein, partial [Elusimicrobia bacterium]|nr:PKD domain-containing protein [Elusimicrobiota bacterium]